MLKTIKSKTIGNIIVGLLLLGAASCSFAADMNFFKLAENDQSMLLLRELFGGWGSGAFDKTSAITVMFKYFNIAMLALGTIIIIYNVVVSIINTAHQGKFLGKKFDTVWGPIRVVLGFILIIPTGSGYSVIQIFIMWMVTQGIGAADTLWKHAVENVYQRGGQEISINTRINEQPLINENASILSALYCMQTKEKDAAPKHTQKCDNVAHVCTSTWDFGPDCGKNMTLTLSTGTFSSGGSDFAQEAQFYLQIQSAAILMDKIWHNNIELLNGFAKRLVSEPEVAKEEFTKAGTNKIATITRNAAYDLSSIMKSLKVDNKPMSKYWQEQIKNGWLTAGLAQFKIARDTLKATMPIDLAKTLSPIKRFTSSNPKELEVLKFINFLEQDALAMSDPNYQMASESSGLAESAKTAPIDTGSKGYLFMEVVQHVTYGISSVIHSFGSTILSIQDPIMALQFLGEFLMIIAMDIYALSAGIISVIAALTSVTVLGTGAAGLSNAIVMYTLGPVMIFSGIIFAEGFLLTFILPLTPFILFISAVIFWFIGVLETMLAGPLTALMFLFLEDSGNDILRGRAGPGINMIINMFMRPMLILFGLVAGMTLTSIVVNFIMKVYSVAIIYVALPSGLGTHTTAYAAGKASYGISYVLDAILALARTAGVIGVNVGTSGEIVNWAVAGTIVAGTTIIFVIKTIILLGILIGLLVLVINKIYTLCIIKLPNMIVSKFFQGGETLGGEEGLLPEFTQQAEKIGGGLKEAAAGLGKGIDKSVPAKSESKAVGVTNTGGDSTPPPAPSTQQVVENTIPPTPTGKGTAGKQGNKSNEAP